MVENKSKIINDIMALGEKDPKVRYALDIYQGKTKDAVVLVEGLWLLNRFPPERFMYLLICYDYLYEATIASLTNIKKGGYEAIYSISKKLYDRLCDRDKGFGVIGIAALEFDSSFLTLSESTILILDGIEQTGNLGTILRTADASGVSGVILVNNKLRLNNPKVAKASMAAILSVPLLEVKDIQECYKLLSKHNYTCFLTALGNYEEYSKVTYPKKTAIIMGSETQGANEEWFALPVKKITIPMLGAQDSLNVSVATGIVCYEVLKKKYP